MTELKCQIKLKAKGQKLDFNYHLDFDIWNLLGPYSLDLHRNKSGMQINQQGGDRKWQQK
jgi:hypothetical protein